MKRIINIAIAWWKKSGIESLGYVLIGVGSFFFVKTSAIFWFATGCFVQLNGSALLASIKAGFNAWRFKEKPQKPVE